MSATPEALAGRSVIAGTFSSIDAELSRRMTLAEVSPYGFPMVCEYEYDKGARTIRNDTYGGDPGWTESIAVLTCVVGGVDIVDMLNDKQHARIADAILSQIRD